MPFYQDPLTFLIQFNALSSAMTASASGCVRLITFKLDFAPVYENTASK